MIRTTCLAIFSASVYFSEGAEAQETIKQSASMQDVLSTLRADSSATETVHFETMMSGQPIGFATASLSPSAGGKGWDYRVEMTMKLPNGPRYINEVKAQLSRLFEPSSIELRREVIDPAKAKEVAIDRTNIGDKEIELTQKAGDAEPTSNKVPRPEGPFVFAMEYFIQRVDFARHPKFEIRELNPQDGSIIVQFFSTTQRPDKSRVVTSKTKEGNPSYTFEFDPSGSLKSWNQQPVPLTFTRCSADRVAEIKKMVSNP